MGFIFHPFDSRSNSLYQIVVNITKNIVALMCFFKYFIVFEIFAVFRFPGLEKNMDQNFKIFPQDFFFILVMSLRGYFNFAEIANSLFLFEIEFSHTKRCFCRASEGHGTRQSFPLRPRQCPCRSSQKFFEEIQKNLLYDICSFHLSN